ncbi:MAG: OmpH family outer membrane protein [Flavipsychrobacter sp.]
MKNLSSVFSTLALIGVIILFILHFSGNKKSSTVVSESKLPASTSTMIAYVDIDSLESNSNYIKIKKDEFKKHQDAMNAELARAEQQMEADAADVQSKAQAGTLTKTDYEAAQKRLGQMQQSYVTRKQALTEQLLKEQDDFNKDLKARLDSFLVDYNKDKHYDYILSYGAGGTVLYGNQALNITQDVIKGMNERANSASATKTK